LLVTDYCSLITSLLFVHVILLIQPIHQVDINVNENDKNVDRALLGEPEAEFEAANFDLIELFGEEKAAGVGGDKTSG